MRGSTRQSSRLSAIATLAVGASLMTPAAASASITIGSDLGLAASGSANNCVLSTPPCTHVLFAVHAGNPFPAKSPTSGVVTSFGIKTGGAESVTFRLARAGVAFGSVIGDGTGPSVSLPGAGTYSFATSLPVRAGDYVGINTSSTRATSSFPGACFNTTGYGTYFPVLPDGGPEIEQDSNSACELLVNAVIEPSNAFSFGKLKRHRKSGSASLTVSVPGPGELSLAGKGVARISRGSGPARSSQTVRAAGKAILRIKAKGKTKARLAASGKAKVKVSVTFAPTGGAPRTQQRKIKLRRRVG